MQVEKEIQEIKERLAQVDEWTQRRDAIEKELAAVWTEQGESLEAPSYVDAREELEDDAKEEEKVEASA